MLNNEFKKSAIEKLKSIDSNELKKAFKEIGSEPMTNEEWLRTLPADERVKEVLSRGFMTEKWTGDEFVEWLKQPLND